MTAELLDSIACRVEKAEPTAHCRVDPGMCQISVTFDLRPDVEIDLLTPYMQGQVRRGYLDPGLYSDMLFTVKGIAHTSYGKLGS